MAVLLALLATQPIAAQTPPPPRGILLEKLTWMEAEKVLTPSTVVVIALGAAAKEHGPHLQLNNDWLIAEYLKKRVLDAADVIVAPTITYHHYPAFVHYPGSTNLSAETAQDLTVQIVKSLAAYGPRKFYIANTGVSTVGPLQQAQEQLAKDGIRMAFTNLAVVLRDVEKEVSKQEGGTHADEIETSMMLFIAPETVDMSKAVKDFHPNGGRPLVRDSTMKGTYSPTGTWGDPTLANRAKGQRVTEALVAGILREIAQLRHQ